MPAVSGTVKDANGNFARRLVRVHRLDTGALVGETLSHPTTGAWSVTTADTSKHYAVAHDSDAWITYLPFNGDNGSTTFPEWGGKTVTAYGNAQISTAQSKFGGASAYFDGSGDGLTCAASADFGMGTGDFTIEAWIYATSVGGGSARVIVDLRNATGAGGGGVFYIHESTGKLAFVDGTSTIGDSGTVVATNTWHHVAASRSGGVLRLFLDGVLDASGTMTTNLGSSQVCGIGCSAIAGIVGSYSLAGYIDDLRISKGVARYIANFTPPSAPHGDALSQMANAMVFDFLTPV